MKINKTNSYILVIETIHTRVNAIDFDLNSNMSLIYVRHNDENFVIITFLIIKSFSCKIEHVFNSLYNLDI